MKALQNLIIFSDHHYEECNDEAISGLQKIACLPARQASLDFIGIAMIIKVLFINILIFCLCIFQLNAQQSIVSSVGANYHGERIIASVTFGQPVADFFENNDGYSSIGFQGVINVENPFITSDNYIQGLVHAGDSLLEFGIVKIIDANSYVAVDSFIVQNGSFQIENVPIGEYILMAVPMEDYSIYYHTTYYVNKTSIEDAYVMPLKTDVEDVDFQLQLKDQFKSTNNNKLIINTYPNPVKEDLYVDFFIEEDTELSLTITNTLGELVYSDIINGIEGQNSIQINVNDFIKGLYIIKLTNNKGLISAEKIVK